jgi:hypothetical protein
MIVDACQHNLGTDNLLRVGNYRQKNVQLVPFEKQKQLWWWTVIQLFRPKET